MLLLLDLVLLLYAHGSMHIPAVARVVEESLPGLNITVAS